REKVEEFPPDTEEYGRLAAFWDEYGSTFVPAYGRFLAAVAAFHDFPVRRVLDLACGTGLLTRQAAAHADAVTGLDRSEAMLRVARARTGGGKVRYVRGDFRDFSLPETFDAAVCGSDSLNYLHEPGELADVFGCVSRHLAPGGFFIFDVLDHRA